MVDFFTGFLGTGSLNDILALFDGYTSGGKWYPSGGYNTGPRLNLHTAGVRLRKNISARKTMVLGFHVIGMRTYNYSSYLDRAIIYLDQTGVTITVWNTTSGLDVRIGNTQVALYPSVVIPNTITHVEIKIYSHSSAGTIEIKVNGVSLGEITGLNTGGNDFTFANWSGQYNNGDISYGTMFVADDWAGELVPVLLKPAADASVQFTPSTGADNYAMVDDVAQDGDTTYVESSTVGHKDVYDFEDLPSGYLVKAVTLVTRARKDDAGVRTFQPVSVQDGTERNVGSAITLSTTYPGAVLSGAATTLSVAPDGSEWSRSILNDVQWGFEVAL